MRINKLCLRIIASGPFIALGFNLIAAPASVTSRAALGGNDFVNWNSAGANGDALGSSFSTTSAGGVGVNVSGATSSVNGFERTDQGDLWNGNFAPGAALLWSGFSIDAQTMTIAFGSPVFGAGAQIQSDDHVAFTAFLNSYDSIGNLLHSDTFSGNSTDAHDNSAIFIGVLNDTANIAKIELGILDTSTPGSFAINRLDLKRVPESGEYLGLAFALTLVGMGVGRSRCRL